MYYNGYYTILTWKRQLLISFIWALFSHVLWLFTHIVHVVNTLIICKILHLIYNTRTCWKKSIRVRVSFYATHISSTCRVEREVFDKSETSEGRVKQCRYTMIMQQDIGLSYPQQYSNSTQYPKKICRGMNAGNCTFASVDAHWKFKFNNWSMLLPIFIFTCTHLFLFFCLWNCEYVFCMYSSIISPSSRDDVCIISSLVVSLFVSWDFFFSCCAYHLTILCFDNSYLFLYLFLHRGAVFVLKRQNFT